MENRTESWEAVLAEVFIGMLRVGASMIRNGMCGYLFSYSYKGYEGIISTLCRLIQHDGDFTDTTVKHI